MLAGAVWLVYGPAIDRVFAADQLWYFAELHGDRSLAAGLRHLDYAATRVYWKGDEALFRPLVFLWLAICNALFAHRHEWWNIAGMAAHAAVALALYRCLLAIQRSWFALAAAVLFVVSKPTIELVLWSHLGGYLLAWMFFLIAVAAFVRVTREPEGAGATRTTLVYTTAFALAALGHESMVIAAALSATLLCLDARGRQTPIRPTRALAWASPVLLFAVMYVVHLARVERPTYVDGQAGGLFGAPNVVRLLPEALVAMGRWSVEVAVPAVVEFHAEPFARFTPTVAPLAHLPAVIANLILSGTLVALTIRYSAAAHLARRRRLLVLLGGSVLAYVVTIAVCRPLYDIEGVVYYRYFFNLAAVLIAYAAVDFTRLTAVRAWLAAGILVPLIVLQAVMTRDTAMEVRRVNAEASRYLDRVSAYVDGRGDSRDRGFRIEHPPEDLDPHIPLVRGYPDGPGADHTPSPRVTELLFGAYDDDAAEADVLDGRALARP